MANSGGMMAIDVSPEMLTLLGAGDVGRHRWPLRSVAFEFDAQLNLLFHSEPTRRELDRRSAEHRMVMLVDRAACERLYGGPIKLEDESYLLPPELRAIAAAIRHCSMAPAAAIPYRLAKSIEFVCEFLSALAARNLVPAGGGSLSFADYRRITAARDLIDNHWGEQLTLASIARRCGLNRSKLSRGFREIYHSSVSEAIAERRLSEARNQLIATDLPVGLIGYRSGYQNNASFSRAFCRRFGVPPSNFRNQAVAA